MAEVDAGSISEAERIVEADNLVVRTSIEGISFRMRGCKTLVGIRIPAEILFPWHLGPFHTLGSPSYCLAAAKGPAPKTFAVSLLPFGFEWRGR